MGKRELLEDIGLALLHTLKDHALDFLISGLLLKPMSKAIVSTANPTPYKGMSRLLSARTLATKAPDGAFIDGPVPIGSAKFAIRKGLPGPDQKRMGVENEPHTVDNFDGEIKEGYGKGYKRLAWAGAGVVKIEDRRFIGRVNIHEHQADKAGLHYDVVIEGVAPGTKQFEINIPGGNFKGRYAFVRPETFDPTQVLITRMKDRGVILAKPTFNLKDVRFLEELDQHPSDNIVEWKPDGSLANVIIKDNRAIFRSHRETGETYYDRLPSLEDVSNHSGLMTNRLLFPGPNLDGTVLRGELFHPEGASRVAGILNSAPDKAIAYQQSNGPVTFYAWDIAKLKSKDVSNLPYGDRRALYEQAISDIRRFNSSWSAVPARTRAFVPWYTEIISDRRGLPYSEGVVIKRRDSTSGEAWAKVKFRDTMDVRVVSILEGIGKRQGTVGRILVETAGGGRGEIGSFSIPDSQLQWIWDNRDILEGQVAEIYAQEVTKAGAPRAGVFIRWHPSKSEAGLLMYALDDRNAMYAMKSAAGWRKK